MIKEHTKRRSVQSESRGITTHTLEWSKWTTLIILSAGKDAGQPKLRHTI
jgi:hypothetical protein